jgi:hypothetical protein
MKKSVMFMLDRIPEGASASVAYVVDGLNVALIAGTFVPRRPGGCWRIAAPGCHGFITTEDRVAAVRYRKNHFRVDLPSREKGGGK